jgi:beta-glucosidase
VSSSTSTSTVKGLDVAARFPRPFLWGAATSSYQIEGAVDEDGRGRSIWDTFCEQPGAIVDASSGEVACDHYHRYADDVALMAGLGVKAYRFSLAWPRIVPDGDGRVEPRGLAFYDRLVDALLVAGIQPWVTLYHWDLPVALHDAGGWTVRDTAARLADYAVVAHGSLGDRVRHWTTLNEPYCSSFLGYASGHHAPGHRDPVEALRSVHHLLLGHGLTVQALKAADAQVQVGIVLNTYPVEAASDRPADLDAARRIDGLQNRLFMDPVLRGHYPADVVADLAPVLDLSVGVPGGVVHEGDLKTVGAPIDLLGLNYYYSSYRVSAGGDPAADPATQFVGSGDVVFEDQGLPRTAMDWEIDPDGLRRSLVRVSHDYPGIPLYITENGAAFPDELVDGAVDDSPRVDYIAAHLAATGRAIDEGADVRGYFAWSLMDNFEWAWGYTRRFGIVHVDYDTQGRTPKAGAHWYSDAITAHGADRT